MSTAPTHFAAAESLLASGRGISADDLEPAQLLAAVIAEAQVHATLALAAATAPATVAGPAQVWWLDDGQEHTDKPPLFTTDSAARGAAVDRFCEDNPFSDQVDWALPEDEGDATGDAELVICGKRTGIFVRPIRPNGGV